jgi:hypothetical protein
MKLEVVLINKKTQRKRRGAGGKRRVGVVGVKPKDNLEQK